MKIEIKDLESALGFPLQKWQSDYILSGKRVLHLRCGRKAGKSQALACRMIIRAVNHGRRQLLVAATEEAAKETFMYVTLLIARLDIEMEYESRRRIIIKGGPIIECMPAGKHGVSVRPKTVDDLYEDEAAFMLDDVHDGLLGCLAVEREGGTSESMSSSPWDESGFFYTTEMFIRKGIIDGQAWHVKSSDCAHVSKDYLAQQRKIMPRDKYAREFDAEYGKAVNQMIPDPVIYGAIREINIEEELKAPAIFIGVDFARFGRDDNAIAWCSYWPETRKARIFRVEIKDSKQRLTSMIGELTAITRNHRNVRKVVTDETGIGGGPTDVLVERLGHRMVLGISNQKRVVGSGVRKRIIKEDLYSRFQSAMEQGELEIINDQKIIFGIKTIRYSYSEDGKYLKIYGRDDHAMEAMVRAFWPVACGMGGLGVKPEIHVV